jgi:hypothetical protein
MFQLEQMAKRRWSAVAVELDAHVMEVYGVEAGRSDADVVPVLSYSHIAKAAFELCSAAENGRGEFCPIEFGNRCEAIAREQRTGYFNGRGPE